MKTQEREIQPTVQQVYLTQPWKWFPSGLPHPRPSTNNDSPSSHEQIETVSQQGTSAEVFQEPQHQTPGMQNHQSLALEQENLQSNSIRNKLRPYYPPSIVFGPAPDQVALKESLFINTKKIPHTLFRFDGLTWIEVDKHEYSVYLDNSSYVKFLKDEYETGKYDFSFLTKHEIQILNAKQGTA